MKSQQPLHDQVFILRFWQETVEASERGRWRVLVKNINTRRRDVVDDLQCAFAIVGASLNAAVAENERPDRLDTEPSKPEC